MIKIGILGDIYRSLDFVGQGGKIDKGGNSLDDIQSRGGMSGERGTLSSKNSLNSSGSDEGVYITGQRGNPANNDSGIAGEGGTVLVGSINSVTFNKISAFQKFMKGAEFQKFMKNDQFQKFMKNGADFQKFQKDAAFQKFMKGADFQKFMKGAKFQKNM